MVSPLLNEDVLIQSLSVAPVDNNARQLQSGAFMLVLDAFDRKVTRDDFMTALAAAVGLHDKVGRLSVLTNIRAFAERNGKVSDVDLLAGEKEAQGLVLQAAADCVKMAHLLQKCPNDEDRVH